MKQIIYIFIIFINQVLAENINLESKINYQDYGNYITPTLIKINRGSFKMISRFGESDETPNTEVSINKDFYASQYETTFREYDKFCEDTNREKPSDEGWGRDNRPVINITFNEAKEYAKWLSNKSGDNYRLPTEIEWEYLARSEGQNSGKWCFGDEHDKFGDYAWSRGNSDKKTHQVGLKKPNKIGIYDIHGNVWEFCDSVYVRNIGTNKSNNNSNKNYIVLRGGSFNNFAVNSLLAFRHGFLNNKKSKLNGFRLVKDIN